MQTQTMTSINNHPFSSFSQRVSNSIATKRALTRLDNHHGLNSASLLFCLWYAENHSKRINQAQAKEIIAMAAYWQERLLNALNQTRKHVALLKNPQQHELSTLVEQTQQEAFAIGQILLANHIQAPDGTAKSLRQIVTDACHNLATFCKLLQIRLDDDDCEAISLILITAFPEYSYDKAFALCKKLLYKPRDVSISETQLKLRW